MIHEPQSVVGFTRASVLVSHSSPNLIEVDLPDFKQKIADLQRHQSTRPSHHHLTSPMDEAFGSATGGRMPFPPERDFSESLDSVRVGGISSISISRQGQCCCGPGTGGIGNPSLRSERDPETPNPSTSLALEQKVFYGARFKAREASGVTSFHCDYRRTNRK